MSAGGTGSRLPEVAPPPGDSYWVIPGRLLAGPYPGAPHKADAAEKLDAFLQTGVTCFVDLTEEGEGPPLHPYAALLRTVAHKRRQAVTYVRLPIRDVDVPSSWHMRAILSTIKLALDEGEVVYVHCWGGVGRTGTVVGCFLIEDGMPASTVLARLGELRTHTERAHRVSPETSAQRTFVETWTGPGAAATTRATPKRVPTRGEIVAMLRNSTVVIHGPQADCCLQAASSDEKGLVRVEVLAPDDSGVDGLGFEAQHGGWLRVCEGEHRLEEAADLMLLVADRWGLAPTGLLTLDDVPSPDADWTQIGEFAQLTFNGYAHFGEEWGERTNAIRERFFASGELPDDIDDLRGALFCEFRMDRFTWGDDVTLSGPDESGVRYIVENPDFETSPTQRYRRAVVARIRELLDAGY